MRTIKEMNGLKLVLVSNYGAIGYMILDGAGKNTLGYVYQGSEESALRILSRKAAR